jgi:molecular chaperone GrpE
MKKENVEQPYTNASEEVAKEPVETVEAELLEQPEPSAELKSQIDEMQQKMLRLQADFDNFRRRSRLEKEDAAKYAALPVLSKILPALDNLDRAISASKQTQDFDVLAKGVEMTARMLFDALQEEGLQTMNVVGELFDPELHQAVLQVESDEHKDGEIVEELQRGYLLKDKVIRPAMVKVNKA